MEAEAVVEETARGDGSESSVNGYISLESMLSGGKVKEDEISALWLLIRHSGFLPVPWLARSFQVQLPPQVLSGQGQGKVLPVFRLPFSSSLGLRSRCVPVFPPLFNVLIPVVSSFWLAWFPSSPLSLPMFHVVRYHRHHCFGLGHMFGN